MRSIKIRVYPPHLHVFRDIVSGGCEFCFCNPEGCNFCNPSM
jgi:hypothetical protein